MQMTVQQQNGPKLMRLLMFTVALSSMGALMLNIVLPQISREFQLSIAQVSWLSSGYTLIYAFGTVTYGKLADKFQLKNLLTIGLLLFGVGSFVGLISQTFWAALLGRCLQSAGASAVPAAAMIIPIRYFSPESRGSALSMTAIGVAMGSALGPVISAFIVSIADWRWLFVPSLLILVLLPFYRKYLIDEPKEVTVTFDWLGGGLLAGSASLFLLGVTNQAWGLIIFGAITLALFIFRIRTTDDPFIKPQIFQNQKYSFALGLAFLINAIGTSLYFVTPLLLFNVFHLSSEWIGFALVPAALASAIMGRKGGKLADLKGNTFLFTIASGLILTCFVLLSSFTGISPIFIAFFLIFGHVGQSFMSIAMSNTISRTLPKDQVGVGMGFFSMMNFMSQGMAAGVYSIVIVIGTTTGWNPANIDPDSHVYSNIYLILAALHVCILWLYYLQFESKKPRVQLEN